jgi:hypothetical protein
MIGPRILMSLVSLCAAHSTMATTKPPDSPAIQDVPYYFEHAPYVHPRIIQDLLAWESDGGDQVVAINLVDSQRSNRYYGDVTVVENAGESPVVRYRGEKDGVADMIDYQYIGKLRSGVHVLETWESGGGTMVSMRLMFVTLENDRGLLVHEDAHVIDLGTPRVLIRKLGEIPLGDRYEGSVELKGSQLRIGADTGRIGSVRRLSGEEPEPDRVFNLDFANP